MIKCPALFFAPCTGSSTPAICPIGRLSQKQNLTFMYLLICKENFFNQKPELWLLWWSVGKSNDWEIPQNNGWIIPPWFVRGSQISFPISEMMAGKVAEIAKKINHLFQTKLFTKPKSFSFNSFFWWISTSLLKFHHNHNLDLSNKYLSKVSFTRIWKKF